MRIYNRRMGKEEIVVKMIGLVMCVTVVLGMDPPPNQISISNSDGGNDNQSSNNSIALALSNASQIDTVSMTNNTNSSPAQSLDGSQPSVMMSRSALGGDANAMSNTDAAVPSQGGTTRAGTSESTTSTQPPTVPTSPNVPNAPNGPASVIAPVSTPNGSSLIPINPEDLPVNNPNNKAIAAGLIVGGAVAAVAGGVAIAAAVKYSKRDRGTSTLSNAQYNSLGASQNTQTSPQRQKPSYINPGFDAHASHTAQSALRPSQPTYPLTSPLLDQLDQEEWMKQSKGRYERPSREHRSRRDRDREHESRRERRHRNRGDREEGNRGETERGSRESHSSVDEGPVYRHQSRLTQGRRSQPLTSNNIHIYSDDPTEISDFKQGLKQKLQSLEEKVRELNTRLHLSDAKLVQLKVSEHRQLNLLEKQFQQKVSRLQKQIQKVSRKKQIQLEQKIVQYQKQKQQQNVKLDKYFKQLWENQHQIMIPLEEQKIRLQVQMKMKLKKANKKIQKLYSKHGLPLRPQIQELEQFVRPVLKIKQSERLKLKEGRSERKTKRQQRQFDNKRRAKKDFKKYDSSESEEQMFLDRREKKHSGRQRQESEQISSQVNIKAWERKRYESERGRREQKYTPHPVLRPNTPPRTYPDRTVSDWTKKAKAMQLSIEYFDELHQSRKKPTKEFCLQVQGALVQCSIAYEQLSNRQQLLFQQLNGLYAQSCLSQYSNLKSVRELRERTVRPRQTPLRQITPTLPHRQSPAIDLQALVRLQQQLISIYNNGQRDLSLCKRLYQEINIMANYLGQNQNTRIQQQLRKAQRIFQQICQKKPEKRQKQYQAAEQQSEQQQTNSLEQEFKELRILKMTIVEDIVKRTITAHLCQQYEMMINRIEQQMAHSQNTNFQNQLHKNKLLFDQHCRQIIRRAIDNQRGENGRKSYKSQGQEEHQNSPLPQSPKKKVVVIKTTSQQRLHSWKNN